MIAGGQRNRARLHNHPMQACVVDDPLTIEKQPRTIIRLEIESVVGRLSDVNTAGPTDVAPVDKRRNSSAGRLRKINNSVHAPARWGTQIAERWKVVHARH